MHWKAFLLFCMVFLCGCGTGHERGVSDPAADFERITGLEWPESARVVDKGDSHLEGYGSFAPGPGVLDGELHLVFDADPKAVRAWVLDSAPWGATWRDGPVPEQIIRNTAFSAPTDPDHLKYAARERRSSEESGSEFAYWDGELLMVDTSSGRVWLSSWDM